jgi:dolichol kinase
MEKAGIYSKESILTLLELYSKKGLDNITVPLGSSLIYYLLTLI